MSVGDQDEDLQSWGWTDLSSYWSAASDSDSEPGSMSRRSLRLDKGLLDQRLPLDSASLNVGGNGWRNTRVLKSQHSASCSGSLPAHAPRKPSNRSLHSDASDASLLSSLLDESSLHEASVRESTLVDNFWGLDHDLDPRESTMMEEQSSMLANRTLTGCDGRCPKHLVHTLTRVSRKDRECCGRESETSDLPSSPSKYTPFDSPASEASTIYSRERRRQSRMDVLQRWLDRLLAGARSAAARWCSALARAWQMCQLEKHGGPASRTDHGGGMSTKQRDLQTNGSLCDDCKEKEHAEQTRVVVDASWSARTWALCRLLWNVTMFTVWCLCWLTLRLRILTRTILSSPSHAADGSSKLGSLFKWTSRQIDSPLLTRFPLALFLVLLIPFSLCWFGLDGLPAVSVLEWRTTVSDGPALSSVDSLDSTSLDSQAAGGAVEDSEEEAPESVRLAGLERSLASLWERVEAGDDRAEQRRETLRTHAELRRSRLATRQLAQLRKRLDDDRRQREQELFWLQSQMSRLDLVEANLHNLAAKAEEATSRQEAIMAAPPAIPCDAASIGTDPRQSHDDFLAHVSRLEATLKDIRRDVDGLLGSWQLERETISSRVHQEVGVVHFGKELQASLASLERNILRNVSHHLDSCGHDEALRDTNEMAVTRKDVDQMVKAALQLFSHDRTGLADYALESGGGSILSTRCSQTYETKAALLSLFGIPLWYFSQSPRVVIQPNVHPGNCWAFRGSAGFLVIRLSMSILPSAFSLEHIPKALAPSGTLSSAPRDFRVYGLDHAGQERGTLLGSYTYREDGEALQTYDVTEENERAFQIIEVQVLTNWGHQEYTCMYRFRVHGSPQDA
ncbi:uncharacterized protein LOC144004532 isoform X2 [Festucalex cinctus]